MSKRGTVRRRKLLKVIGAGAVASTAGCTGGLPGLGGGGGSSGGDQEFMEQAQQLGLNSNVQQRRLAAADQWSIEARKGVPDRQNDTTWTNSESFKTAPWEPPEGWQDTGAGEVIRLAVEMEEVHLFDGRTGENLLR